MATKQRQATSPEVTTVNLPGVTAEFHQPDHVVPTRDDLSATIDTVRGYLPSNQMMAYYGGLGLLVAFSMIEWPVAAAIGVGTAIVQREHSASSSESRSRRSGST